MASAAGFLAARFLGAASALGASSFLLFAGAFGSGCFLCGFFCGSGRRLRAFLGFLGFVSLRFYCRGFFRFLGCGGFLFRLLQRLGVNLYYDDTLFKLRQRFGYLRLSVVGGVFVNNVFYRSIIYFGAGFGQKLLCKLYVSFGNSGVEFLIAVCICERTI